MSDLRDHAVLEVKLPDSDDADRVIEKAQEGNGEYAIALSSRIGATPFLRYTPYYNNRGVKVHMWSCRSITPKAMPGRTLLLSDVNIIDPDEYDDYPLRMFTTEWVWHQVFRARIAEVLPVEDTPFGDANYGRYIDGHGGTYGGGD